MKTKSRSARTESQPAVSQAAIATMTNLLTELDALKAQALDEFSRKAIQGGDARWIGRPNGDTPAGF